jgi:hypothetical protein
LGGHFYKNPDFLINLTPFPLKCWLTAWAGHFCIFYTYSTVLRLFKTIKTIGNELGEQRKRVNWVLFLYIAWMEGGGDGLMKKLLMLAEKKQISPSPPLPQHSQVKTCPPPLNTKNF